MTGTLMQFKNVQIHAWLMRNADRSSHHPQDVLVHCFTTFLFQSSHARSSV